MDLGNGFLYIIPKSDNYLTNSFSSFIKNIDLNSLNKNILELSKINKVLLENIKNKLKNLDNDQFLFFKNIKLFNNIDEYNLIISKNSIKPYKELIIDSFILIGHRGYGTDLTILKDFEENTIDSFKKAHLEGADMIELDVHLTKDEYVVVYHNDFIGNKRICDLTYSDFLFYVNNQYEFTNKPTSFKKILESLDYPIGINVEIKNCNKTDSTYLLKLIQAIWKIIKIYKKKTFFFSSFSPLACIFFKILSSNANVFLLIDVNNEDYLDNELDNLILFSKIFDLSGFVISSDYFEKHFKNIHKLIIGNKKVFCYGNYTNNKLKSEKLIKYGISGLITDNLKIYKKI